MVLGTVGLQPNEKEGARDSVEPQAGPLLLLSTSQKEPKLLVGVWFGPERRSKGKADESQLCWETATDGRGEEELYCKRPPGIRGCSGLGRKVSGRHPKGPI